MLARLQDDMLLIPVAKHVLGKDTVLVVVRFQIQGKENGLYKNKEDGCTY